MTTPSTPTNSGGTLHFQRRQTPHGQTTSRSVRLTYWTRHHASSTRYGAWTAQFWSGTRPAKMTYVWTWQLTGTALRFLLTIKQLSISGQLIIRVSTRLSGRSMTWFINGLTPNVSLDTQTLISQALQRKTLQVLIHYQQSSLVWSSGSTPAPQATQSLRASNTPSMAMRFTAKQVQAKWRAQMKASTESSLSLMAKGLHGVPICKCSELSPTTTKMGPLCSSLEYTIDFEVSALHLVSQHRQAHHRFAQPPR